MHGKQKIFYEFEIYFLNFPPLNVLLNIFKFKSGALAAQQARKFFQFTFKIFAQISFSQGKNRIKAQCYPRIGQEQILAKHQAKVEKKNQKLRKEFII
jgi:hypothetical protein